MQSPPVQEVEHEEKQAIHEDQIEEIAEAIIEEKWEDLMKEIKKLMVWKEGMTAKMAAPRTEFHGHENGLWTNFTATF